MGVYGATVGLVPLAALVEVAMTVLVEVIMDLELEELAAAEAGLEAVRAVSGMKRTEKDRQVGRKAGGRRNREQNVPWIWPSVI